ncbi:MAG: hypothetical protein RL417_1313 [Pseudomonadota bacterium]|jgi:spermidine synthase
MDAVLLASVFIVATCGLVYELVAGTVASYLLGDSVTQFSTVIGTYLSAMGVGSYLAQFVKRRLLETFVRIEIVLALIGGTSATLLFLTFEFVTSFRLVLYGLVFVIGMFVGLEIPLLLRILRDRIEFSALISRVLSFDYLGALAASVLFPLILAPQLGLVRTAFLFGLMNAAVALWVLAVLGDRLPSRRALAASAWVVFALLLGGFIGSNSLVAFAEAGIYADPVIYAKTTPYQRIILTNSPRETKLFLNGALQFSSRDEYRYHEALVHPGLSAIKDPRRVLILGGGDGLAAREVLRYPTVEAIVLVDLDPAITDLFRSSELPRSLNDDALNSPKVTVINADAFRWLKEYNGPSFDFIIVDFPDPTNFSLGKLYTTTFYRSVKRVMGPQSRGVIQSTSPLLARRSFWCIHNTVASIGVTTLPYHVYLPSFGEWGFVLFTSDPSPFSPTFPPNLRFIDAETFSVMRRFAPDMSQLQTEINRLDNQILVSYYENEWSEYL